MGADDYRRGAVFKKFGIDFCCGGGRTVEEACARKGVDIEALPVLRNFAAKLARVHGPHTPVLLAVDRAVRALSEEMDAHIAAEEDEVFSAIRAGDGASAALEQMEEKHEAAGALMAQIRGLTSDFIPPAGACATWRAMYAKLEEFEADLHRHIHLENNVFFPAVRSA